MNHPATGIGGAALSPPRPRRRVLQLVAASTAMAAAGAGAAGAGPLPAYRWAGRALGAPASVIAYDERPSRAAHAVQDAVAELARLERLFSLHRADSALRQLNADGRLWPAPRRLRDLLGRAITIAGHTGGAFDPTVQPLWQLHASHFQAHPGDRHGPPAADLRRVRETVDLGAVEIGARHVRLARPGMALTLNGIAQGFITDRLAARLRAHGLHSALLDAGEISAIGRHPQGRRWRAGIRDPRNLAGAAVHVELDHQSLATSARYGTVFEPSGQFHHLFDPSTGLSTHRYASTSVICASATTADALSTAFASLAPDAIERVLKLHAPAQALLLHRDGTMTRLQA